MGDRVRPGETLRDFQLKDLHGQSVRLSDFRGKRVLLSFFRDAGCPFCNLRLFELTSRYNHYQQQGLEIVTVFYSTPHTVKRFLGNRNRPFALLADPEKDVFRLYGVESSWGALMKGMFNFPRMMSAFAKGFLPSAGAFKPLMPADFLIDQTGKVRATYYSRDAARHISLKLVDRFIAATEKLDTPAPAAAPRPQLRAAVGA
ncbi:MAG: peroxiredoxin family protein [Gammaproteobacteria bacterium]|nr:peroxiredoxin family protein [Gammaproteobacteria bacterium]